jgi:hypothetical protein
MAVTYDIATDVGRVRLLITDTDVDNPIFQDEEIQVFLDMTISGGANDIRLAAAEALDTIARNEALVLKRITLMDLQTDGPAVAKALSEQADRLREQSDSDAEIDVIEMGLTDANRTEILWNDALRDE